VVPSGRLGLCRVACDVGQSGLCYGPLLSCRSAFHHCDKILELINLQEEMFILTQF
jgi:hypothetical protein